jgi:hypothetical protein
MTFLNASTVLLQDMQDGLDSFTEHPTIISCSSAATGIKFPPAMRKTGD